MKKATERILRALDAIRAGHMVVLVDDEDRENEGDLCMAAEHVTAETINFMARHGRGLICLTLTPERVHQLELPMMVDDNRAARRTAFTVSIEAKDGVSTGISAADRALTIRTAVAKQARPTDLVSPGHVFPLRAKPGGVLQRTGHTEGSVDLARLAECDPSGVICEIMNDDGTMARLPDLLEFAKRHALEVVSIADLVQYRMQTERLVHCVRTGELSLGGERPWKLHVYETRVEHMQLLALTLGSPSAGPTLVRVHTGTVFGDIFGVQLPNRTLLREAVDAIERAREGVILFIPGSNPLDAELGKVLGAGHPPSEPKASSGVDDELREYGFGAQVLRDLGLQKIRVLTRRPRKIVGLEGYGLEVVEQVRVDSLTSPARTRAG